jgi:HAD superfamily hydrolase (TIGR01549 family)
MVEAVIFDVDGTLVDSVDLHARAWQEALAHFGHEVEFQEVREQIGKGGDQLMPVFVPEEELARIGAELDDFRKKLYQEKYLPQVKGIPGVRALFQRLLADGKRIALASSAKGEELAAYKRLAGIDDLLGDGAAQASSDDAEKSKPHPDIFEAALAQLGHPAPNVCVVVGDTPYDVTAARAAHLRTVGVLCGGFPAESIWGAGAVAVYRDPKELLEHYERSPDTALEGGLAAVEEAGAPG